MAVYRVPLKQVNLFDDHLSNQYNSGDVFTLV